jgi:hypothetical protein
MNMNFRSKQIRPQSLCSTAEVLATKDAALRAALDYLEYKNGPGEWFKDELAYRLHRKVEKALEFPAEQERQPLEFLELNRRRRD